MKFYVLLLVLSIGVLACQEPKNVLKYDLEIDADLNYDISDVNFVSMNIVLTNKITGDVFEGDLLDDKTYNLVEGVYSAKIDGEIEYRTSDMSENSKLIKSRVSGVNESFVIKGEDSSIKINLFIASDKSGFLLSEIYFAGSRTPKDSYYGSDTFFEIYNNSNKVLYADGLCISESLFSTAKKQNYIPNIMDEYVAVRVVYSVPGRGRDYPVQPGETIVIADVAKNHLDDNTNSFDLSTSDFEWFDDNDKDVDVPSVPNMIKVYSYSKSSWTLHNRGYRSYILYKMNKPVEKFLSENKYDCTYEYVYSGGSKNIKASGYKVDNSIIIDAVCCSVPSKFEWLIMSPSLDMSYTHAGNADAARYGKSVSRKVSHVDENGRVILLDTNNSVFDFIPTSEPTPGLVQ